MKNRHVLQRRTSAVALISVLAVTVLITALVVGFLTRAGSERVASANYDATATTRMLADTTVNLVQASINEATTQQDTAWASQPGLIRVFDDRGDLQRLYRLYSAPELISATKDAKILASDVPTDPWLDSPALWTDLNAPVLVPASLDAQKNPVPAHLVYPILDPRDPANPGSVSNPKVAAAMPGFSIGRNAPAAPGNQPAPMPVRWLYVLRDGQIVAPSGSGKIVNISGAMEENPIVGRIAFWTDDETAKVNVNTAGGSLAEWNNQRIPATWDTPRFKIWLERMLFSENQPVKGEYQRYPGHPATTDLFSILNALGVSLASYPYAVGSYSASPQPGPASDTSGLAALLPRYSDSYSSRGGSRNTTKTSTPPVINNGAAKQERLYASTSEMLFDPQRGKDVFTAQQLESGKFFLTTHSRAPELTLFGTPRIAMWPIHSTASKDTRTVLDNLIARCSTVGGQPGFPFHIQRNDSRSATSDYDNIGRNRELYSYLQDLTSRDIPGFGGKFTSKYSYTLPQSNERDQILTELIDYIRCTNLHDNSVASNSGFVRFTTNPAGISGYSFQGQVTPLKITANGHVTQGLGRIQTLSEIGIHIICTADGNSPLGPYVPPVDVGGRKTSPVLGSANDPLYVSNLPEAQFLRRGDGTIVGIDTPASGTTPAEQPFPANPTLTATGQYGGPLQALAPGEKKLQAMLLFEIACPMMGFDTFQLNDPGRRPAYKVKVANIQGVSIDDQFPFPDRTTFDSDKTGSLDSNVNGNGFIDWMSTRTTVQGSGGLMGFRYLIGDKSDRYNSWSGKNPYTSGKLPYRYISNPFKVSSSRLSLRGEFTVELHVPVSETGSTAYQSFHVTFPVLRFDPTIPESGVPLPDLPKHGFAGNDGSGNPFAANVPAEWWGFDARIARSAAARSNGNGSAPIHGLGTVIRADVPVTGTWSWTKTASVRMPTFANQAGASFSGSDVVRTLVAKDGDYRLVAARNTISADGTNHSPFVPGPGYYSNAKLGHLFKDQNAAHLTAGVDNGGKLVKDAPYSWAFVPKVPSNLDPGKQLTWDWDNGLPAEPDGAYANKPDEGNIYVNNQSPYYNREQQGSMDNITSYFTANRIVSSPVMFGSLPTGVVENVSWRTLLFRPQMNRPYDPQGPKDHLLLDLFWMPVVEPYAISEPFSTGGKVNMNYQIVPFTYLTRSTAVEAVLSSELVARVPKNGAANLNSSDHNTYYKGKPGSGASTPPNSPPLARLPLNLSESDGALRQFKEKFDDWEIFKSASEICDVYLTPEGYFWNSDTVADAAWYGDDFAMVGDNVRERPYGNIYPRLTTKSNTFTVHYRVQALKSPGTVQAGQWNETRGQVLGEYRGSTTLERYLNPNNSDIPDHASTPDAKSLDYFYQWRVVANRAFAP